MDGNPDTTRELLASLLAKQEKSQNGTLVGFIDSVHPLIKLLAPFIAAFIWFQANFATTQMYRDQEAKILETNLRLDVQYKEMKLLIDQRYQEGLVHSNDNRDRMMAVMSEIKDSLKTLYFDRQAEPNRRHN